ncbi:MAG: hypothetical protein HYS59_00115 [Candidatus Vogelbacteria bacterium]|nr:hypothetical protein [Candidatus Vogelbacteria bacterium]
MKLPSFRHNISLRRIAESERSRRDWQVAMWIFLLSISFVFSAHGFWYRSYRRFDVDALHGVSRRADAINREALERTLQLASERDASFRSLYTSPPTIIDPSL